MIVGLISDTHGLVRPEVIAALSGTELILHAGDVGGWSVLTELRAIAPVHAVSGNVDGPELALPRTLALTLGGLRIHVSHGHELGSPTPANLASRYTADMIVYGHTHKPLIESIGSTLVVNPGAAGPRRFNLKPSVALLHIERGTPRVEIVYLPV